jgi:glycosyltransferase involved in cell wall biosynthesis
MPSFIQACDIAVLISWSEGMPNALIEAMACGLPALATRVGGIPEAVLHETTGLLVSPGDVTAIADGLSRLLNESSERERFGLEARHICVTRFDARENTYRLAALFEETAFGHRRRLKDIKAAKAPA